MPRNDIDPRALAGMSSGELEQELEDLKRQVDALFENFPQLKTFVPRGLFDPGFHPLLDGFRTDEHVALIALKRRMAAVSLELSKRSKSSGGPIRVAVTGIKPETIKRRTVILQNKDKTALEICGLLDAENVSLPSGKNWEPFKDWREAYRDRSQRKRIDTLISKQRGEYK